MSMNCRACHFEAFSPCRVKARMRRKIDNAQTSENLRGSSIMLQTSRRMFVGALALGASAFSAARAFATAGDGHASGYDVVPSSQFMALVPRKTGDAVT